MADDYFTAIQRVKGKLQLGEEKVVKVQVYQLIKRLETPELCFEERLDIATQLHQALGAVYEHAPHKGKTSEEKFYSHGFLGVIAQ